MHSGKKNENPESALTFDVKPVAERVSQNQCLLLKGEKLVIKHVGNFEHRSNSFMTSF